MEEEKVLQWNKVKTSNNLELQSSQKESPFNPRNCKPLLINLYYDKNASQFSAEAYLTIIKLTKKKKN